MVKHVTGLLMLVVCATFTLADDADRAAAQKLVAEASDPAMKDQRDKAIELCTRAIELDPTCVKAYVRRAWVRHWQVKYEQAAEDMAKAVELDPKDDLHWSRLVWYRERSHQLDEAVDAAKKGLEANPDSGRLYLELGVAYGLKNQPDDAIPAMLMGIALSDVGTINSVRGDLGLRMNADMNNALLEGTQKALAPVVESKKKIDEGNAALETSDVDAAMKCFDEAVKLCSDNAAAYVARGNGLVRSEPMPPSAETVAKAEADFGRAMKLCPTYAEPYVAVGRLRQRQRGPSPKEQANDPLEGQAWANFNKAIELRPTCAAAYMERGSVFVSKHLYWAFHGTGGRGNIFDPYKGDYLDKALADFAAAIKLDPTLTDAYVRRAKIEEHEDKDDDAIKDLDAALRIDPKLKEALELRWPYYKNKKEWDGQIDVLTRLVDLDNTPTKYLDERGLAYLQKLELEAALADFDTFLAADLEAIEPRKFERGWRKANAFAGRGRVFMEKGDGDKAKKDFDEALKLNPKNYPALLGRGELYHMMGKIDHAQSDFLSAALQGDGHGPGREPARARMAAVEAHVDFANGELASAMTHADDAVERDPTYWRGVAIKAMLLANAKQTDKAIETYTQLTELRPKMAEAYVKRAEQYWAKNDAASAIADLDCATELESEDPQAWSMLGEIQLKTGHPDEAAKSFEQVAKLTPDYAPSHLILAVIYASNNDKEAEARKQLETGLANATPDEIRAVVAASEPIEKEHPNAALLKEILAKLKEKGAAEVKKAAE